MASLDSGPVSRQLQSRSLDLGPGRLHYLEAGEGDPPLVLLHGTAIDSSSLTFGPSLPRFAETRRVLAPDWPGYGKSEAELSGLNIPFFSRLLEQLLDAEGVEKADLLGFSMGGGVALEFVLSRQSRVRKLILVDSYGLGKELHLPLLPYLALRTPLLARAVWGALRRSRPGLELLLRTLIFRDGRRLDPALLSEVAEQLRLAGSEASFMDWLRTEMGLLGLATSYLDDLEFLQVPTLLIHGSHDRVVPLARAERAAQRLPDGSLKVLEAGHWSPRERPTAFQEAVLEFLETEPQDMRRSAEALRNQGS